MIFAVVLPDELVRYIFTLLQPTAVGGMMQVCNHTNGAEEARTNISHGCLADPDIRRGNLVSDFAVLVSTGSVRELSKSNLVVRLALGTGYQTI